MAGTRLFISAIVLGELLALTAWSLWHGLCWKNDDILCHIFEEKKLPKPLRRLPWPAWWTTTLNIHLVVEQPQSLPKWAATLQSWVESSKIEEWPYFGSTEIYMQVVQGRQWSKAEMLTSKETDTLWNFLPDGPIDIMKSADHDKSMDWILYIPSSSIVTSNNTEETGAISSWSSWIRKKHQLLTVLLVPDNTHQQDWSNLKSLVGPWLEVSTTTMTQDDKIRKQTENDFIRKLQLVWHQSVAEDVREWKAYLTHEEHTLALSHLGKVSKSFSDRLQNLQQARLIVEAAVARQDISLTPEFPLPHYAAVFFPLLFPLLMPFLAAFIKEVRRYKKKKKERGSKATKNAGNTRRVAEHEASAAE
jgi:hypothetical protein